MEDKHMPSYYGNRENSITNQEILEAYCLAYRNAHGSPPTDCEVLSQNQFRINGRVHDRRWVLLEIERLRQEALMRSIDPNTRGIRAKRLRRLSDI